MNRFRIALLGVVAVVGIIVLAASRVKNTGQILPFATTTTSNLAQNASPSPQVAPTFTVLTEGLEVPWSIAFLPDKSMLVTERVGRVWFIDADGKFDPTPVAQLENVKGVGEGGLLGLAVHPKFPAQPFVYLYYTYRSDKNATTNRVVRMTYREKKLSDEQILIDNIPGASNHNGGRMKFGPDAFLYITTGDAEDPPQAQDISKLGGKILRITDDGKPAPGNPFRNLVYSYGHRNSQGLTWDSMGQLWATEHGRSGALSGLDELNKIEVGKNYGWPTIQGDEAAENMVRPIFHSGSNTWAPAGAAIFGGSVFFGGLRGQVLYEVNIDGKEPTLKEHFSKQFGRIRDVVLGPDNMLYITTSNRDGRGNPTKEDDKIIKIDPSTL